LEIRWNSVARIARKDCDTDSILDEIENAVGGWHFLDNVRFEPGLRTLFEEPSMQCRMRPLRTRNDQRARSEIGKSDLSAAVRRLRAGKHRMKTLKTEWELRKIIPVERRQCQGRLECPASDGFECF